MGLDHLRWFDLFDRRGTRRDFLRIGGSAAALVTLGGTLPARRGDPSTRFRTNPFLSGIASGDPSPEGVVLWTRLDPLAVTEAAGPDARVPVRWEIAEDDSFRRVVKRGDALALPELGHTVHAEAAGLDPARVYFYRFLSGGVVSGVGRARTAPAPGARVDRMRFAYCSCQNYEDGFFTAYKHMAEEDLDLVVHLGDYIYEGGITRNAPRQNDSAECYTLDQYRHRLEQYRRDEDLQAAHAAFSFVTTWDDHDVDNNYAGTVAEERDRETPEEFLLRRAAAYQAYYEFMPLRRASMPRGPYMGLYRRLRFGDLLEMNVLDTRQYRADQACGDRFKPDCAARLDGGRTMLGDEQERWLLGGMKESRARWSVIAQQVMMAPLHNRNTTGEATHNMDIWDGYPVARQRLLDAWAAGVARNPIVITGDIHESWVADLHVGDIDSPIVATELVSTSITTDGDGWDFGPGEDEMLPRNPHMRWHDIRRGYVRADVTPDAFAAHYRVVPWIRERGSPVETRAVWVVEDGQAGAVRDAAQAVQQGALGSHGGHRFLGRLDHGVDDERRLEVPARRHHRAAYGKSTHALEASFHLCARPGLDPAASAGDPREVGAHRAEERLGP